MWDQGASSFTGAAGGAASGATGGGGGFIADEAASEGGTKTRPCSDLNELTCHLLEVLLTPLRMARLGECGAMEREIHGPINPPPSTLRTSAETQDLGATHPASYHEELQ